MSDGRRSNLDGGESSWEDYELVFVSDGPRPPGRITNLSLCQTAEDLIWTVANPPGRIKYLSLRQTAEDLIWTVANPPGRIKYFSLHQDGRRSNLDGSKSSLEDYELVFASDGRRSNLDGGKSSWED